MKNECNETIHEQRTDDDNATGEEGKKKVRDNYTAMAAQLGSGTRREGGHDGWVGGVPDMRPLH